MPFTNIIYSNQAEFKATEVKGRCWGLSFFFSMNSLNMGPINALNNMKSRKDVIPDMIEKLMVQQRSARSSAKQFGSAAQVMLNPIQ
ncbi:MAG: hypothetical protein GY749_07330 [Desulfobacteraceae bacterium]|nr:hypothetical protein [Desulfobacteraceae bacterium]